MFTCNSVWIICVQIILFVLILSTFAFHVALLFTGLQIICDRHLRYNFLIDSSFTSFTRYIDPLTANRDLSGHAVSYISFRVCVEVADFARMDDNAMADPYMLI